MRQRAKIQALLPGEGSAGRAALQAAAEARAAEAVQDDRDLYGADDDADELTRDSNAIIDLVHEGKLDQAEKAAREFLERYPEVHDGYDRLGMVYEARGDRKAAADYYRKVVEFVKAHPKQYEPTFTATSEQIINELDPPPPT